MRATHDCGMCSGTLYKRANKRASVRAANARVLYLRVRGRRITFEALKDDGSVAGTLIINIRAM